MERRQFITRLACGTVGLIALPSFAAGNKENKLTILHTNDTHSHIDPFPSNHKKYPGKGGVNRRKALIDKIRKEEKQVLLLDAGDIFQGTPYFNMHHGELEFKVMSAMGYDAATMGNHDFDAGIDGFKEMLPHADFPFLCANYDFDNTVLKGHTKPYQVFQKGPIKIGVFGVGVELDGLVSKSMYKDTVYQDPIEKANYWAAHLKNEEKCDLVVCLSHLGYFPRLNKMCDKVLADSTENIDLIIGGHTHTFMQEPEMRKNKAKKSVLVNQVGWAGLILGRIDFYFDTKGNPDVWASNVLSTQYEIA
ncbi:metallophosphatase [Paracrocinitomix mangrovi]|uniref:bifunctional metallophosphatase/5'-nucleotidase n=1 Tax=Paracrocinitomix mangrovi TaxID=2862509 RepID=UPI001C8DBC95|nr:metallophosphatase [Paracrocinitomix mangrovi]UKN02099.1 metallophosphatase [Paracrocinitomix mangrovi]